MCNLNANLEYTMSWFDTALSVTSTIGKVAGALVGGGIFRAVAFDIQGNASGQGQIGQILFQLDNQGHIWALNTSTVNACQLFFPGNPEGAAQQQGASLMLGSFSKVDVTKAFNTYAAADVNDFLITPSNVSQSIAQNGGSSATIQSMGSNIPPNTVTALGPYFNVTANVSDRTVQIALLGGMVLSGIVLLNVRGAGATFCRIANILKKKKSEADDDNSITVALPTGVDISNGLQSIDIIAATTSNSIQRAVEEFAKNHNVQRISDNELANLTKVTVG